MKRNISFSQLKRIILEETEEQIPNSIKNRISMMHQDDDTSSNDITIDDVRDRGIFDYDLAFDFLQKNDSDTLKVMLKNMLRRVGLPFRSFEDAKEHFDTIRPYSDERIDYEENIRRLCEDYIEDIDPEEYDRHERNRRNMNNYMMGMMMGVM